MASNNPDPEEIGTINAFRRFSEIKLSTTDPIEASAELTYIDTIRRVSGVNLVVGRSKEVELKDIKLQSDYQSLITAKNENSTVSGTIQPGQHRLSSSEIGVIEAVRRLSGVNAALGELGAPLPLKPNPDKDKYAAGYAKLPSTDLEADQKKKKHFGLGDKDWHLLSEDDILRELKTNLQGLSPDEHARRLAQYGPNAITPPKQQPYWLKVLKEMVGGFQLMLWIGSFLCFAVFGISKGTDVQNLALAIVLMLVVIITTVFQLYQEGKSDKVMAALKALSPTTSFVYRNGELCNVPTESLVPGDVVKVTGGEKVPADVRILSAADLKVNNASLTGENVDIKLGKEALHQELYEAKNIARSGCNFTSGYGLGVVFATGDHTFFGTIAHSTTQIEHPETLMKHEIHRLIYVQAMVAFTLGIAFLILALFNGYSAIEAIVFMIGIVVANVPEGLLPQLTVALTLTAQRMLKLGVLVSNLEIIETLGAVDIICSDKTGTLTCNRMTVSHIVVDNTIYITPISPIMANDAFAQFDAQQSTFQQLQRIASLNTEAVFLPSSANEPDVLKKETKGDASESAIIKFFQPLRDIATYRQSCPRLFCVPFNSSNKWMLSVNRQEGDDQGELPLLLLVKGAPERVMNMCTSILVNGESQPFDEAARERMEGMNEQLAKRGERVLAFAHFLLPIDKYPHDFAFDYDAQPPNFPINGLTLVGFVSLIDPPRLSVKPAIAQCNTAGIGVFMVTGDHPITAHAIAKSLGIITHPTAAELKFDGVPVPPDYRESIVVHGTEMQSFTEEDWTRVLRHKQIVFARTMPQQKQDIVRELNKLGKVVAMTGDGVNDAPALKASNVGIAMGSGAAVAKEAAQLILLSDDFGAIVDGIREGRLIFENLKKCVAYVLSSNIPELVPFLLFIALKIPLAIETISILFIDLGTDLAPAIALAYEEPEDAIMQAPPRTEHDHLVGVQMMCVAYGTIGMFQNFAGFFAYFWAFYDHGFTLQMLMGAAIEYRTPFDQLNTERQDFFHDLCMQNHEYRPLSDGPDRCNDGQDFFEYRMEALAYAQGAFLMTVVWSQIANALTRKTQLASILSFERLFSNRAMLYSFLSEIVIIIAILYGAGPHFYLYADSVYGSCALWIIPFIILWEEVRKWICRTYPDGWVRKFTVF